MFELFFRPPPIPDLIFKVTGVCKKERSIETNHVDVSAFLKSAGHLKIVNNRFIANPFVRGASLLLAF